METMGDFHESSVIVSRQRKRWTGFVVHGQSECLNLLFNFQGSMQKEATTLNGGVAQLGEHLPCKQGVKGSNPFISTIPKPEREREVGTAGKPEDERTTPRLSD